MIASSLGWCCGLHIFLIDFPLRQMKHLKKVRRIRLSVMTHLQHSLRAHLPIPLVGLARYSITLMIIRADCLTLYHVYDNKAHELAASTDQRTGIATLTGQPCAFRLHTHIHTQVVNNSAFLAVWGIARWRDTQPCRWAGNSQSPGTTVNLIWTWRATRVSDDEVRRATFFFLLITLKRIYHEIWHGKKCKSWQLVNPSTHSISNYPRINRRKLCRLFKIISSCASISDTITLKEN